MKIFGPLYDRVIEWSRHRFAERYLAALSFAESSFFPIPVDVMLAPMCLARLDKAWRFAFIVAGFSPIPYKVFTIAAGVAALNLPAFFIGSMIGRGARFFLVAGLLVWGGATLETRLRQYVERIGWAVVALVAIVIAWFMVRG